MLSSWFFERNLPAHGTHEKSTHVLQLVCQVGFAGLAKARTFERELPADSALAEVIRVRRKIHKPGTSPMFSCGTLTLERCPSN